MDKTIEDAIRRNYDRILDGKGGRAYKGREDDLREGLRLIAVENLEDHTPEETARILDGVGPAAPGIALMYF